MAKKKKKNLATPVNSELLLEFVQQAIKENRLDKISADQVDRVLKEYRSTSEDKIEAFMKRLTPEVRYKIKREYTRFINGGFLQSNPGVSKYRLQDLSPKFRKELDNAITTSLGLIKTQNQQTMLQLEQRFRGWVMTPPAKEMLTDYKNTVEKPSNKSVRHLQFVIEDQYHKMIGAMDEITGQELGAIGFIWRGRKDNREVGKPGGLYPVAKNPKMHGNHYEREGVFYLDRNSPAVNKGYVVPRDGVAYSDSLEDGPPGKPIGCRCTRENVYDLSDIPEKYKGCITAKGKEYIDCYE